MALPEEVIADILSRLAVEPILRFRCVCPKWRDLIDSLYFVKLHLGRSIETDTNTNLVFFHPGLQIAKLRPSDCSLQTTELDHHPFGPDETGIVVWGSCNGLLCLVNSSDTFVLWNPSTRKHVKLPDAISGTPVDESLRRQGRGYGFGYDPVGDDYKVLRIEEIARKRDGFTVSHEVQVYSNKSDSWHMVETFHNLPFLQYMPGKFAAGALHFTMGSDPKKIETIVAFDLGTEKCRIVPGPKLASRMQCLTIVDSFQETIAMVAKYFLQPVDVWVMKEYGVEESWTKLFSLTGPCYSPFYCPKNSGEVLMLHNRGFIWFNTKQESIKNVEVSGRKGVMPSQICIGSLVPLCGSGKVILEKKKKSATKRNYMSGFLSKGFKLVL